MAAPVNLSVFDALSADIMAAAQCDNALIPDAGADLLTIALAHVSDAVIVTDAGFCLTYMNPAAESLLGKPFSDVLGLPLTEVLSIVHAESGLAIDAAIESVRHSDTTVISQQHAVLVGSTLRPVVVEYGLTPLRGTDGRLSGTVAIFRDVTHRRAAELALQSSEETLLANAQALFEEKERAQVTLNSIGDAVISTDFRGRVSFMNVVAEKMTGWSQAEAAGRLLDEIFFLVDSNTRQHIPCPAMQAVIEDRTVGLGSTCVLIRRDGVETAVEDSASPIHDKQGGVVGAVMVAHDVTIARDLSQKLARVALHDNLTDLPNRTLFADRLGQALARASRTGNSVAVLFVDLDRFKPVNDSLGHSAGDRLLQSVASRLLTCVRSSDTVSRYGGDEFIVLLADVAHAQDAALCADKIIAAFAEPYDIGGRHLKISASIGIASFPGDARDAETLLRYADIAMYQAKTQGRNGFEVFSRSMLSPEVC